MHECIASCFGTWASQHQVAALLPVAYLAVTHLNGFLGQRKDAPEGIGKALALVGSFIDRVSFHTRGTASGTFKLPGTASMPSA